MGTMVTVSFSLLTVALLLAGCSTGSLYGKPSLGGLAPDDAIVIMAHDDAPAQEGKLVACARRELKGSRWANRIVAPDEFRRLALTNPGQQPRSHADWAELAREPLFQERIASLNLRYLIVLDEEYWKSPSRWDWTFDPRGVFFGGGVFVLVNWDVSSRMSAQIFDLPNARSAGSLTAFGSGTSRVFFMQVLLVVPLPLAGWPSFPEGVACRKLGEGVSEALLGNQSSETRD